MDAQTLTAHLRGKWFGAYGVAPCPCCQPEGRRDQHALTLSDGRDGQLLLHCKKLGCAFADILRAAGVTRGDYRPPDPAILAEREAERHREEQRRAEQAKRCWDETVPIGGTIAERYLRNRAIDCPLPPTLRFHPAAWHGATARRYPALVARIDGADSFAVHRTYLRPDGGGKADVSPAKAMLGATRGGAVRLSGGHLHLAVAEGIETALSLLCGLLREPATIWAALSTSGMAGLRLPRRAGRLTIAPDGDAAGRKAALELAERAHAAGWTVGLLIPPEGRDWNNELQMETAK